MIDRFEHCRFCYGAGCAACPEEHKKYVEAGGKHPEPRPPSPPPSVGPCYVCGEPARFLCDGVKRHEIDPRTRKVIAHDTCDRPMCDRHVACQSRVHVQRAGPSGRGRRCSWETIDHCKECKERRDQEIEVLAALEREARESENPMRLFEAKEISEAIYWVLRGGQSLHLHTFIADRVKAPRVFVQAVDRGEQIAHLFDRDRARLEETARRFGVRIVAVEREGTSRQHVDLCGGPLRKAIAEATRG